MREFAKNGHDVSILSPIERRFSKATYTIEEAYGEKQNVHLLKIKTGNIQKTNIVEKGISTLLIERQFIRGIKKYFSEVKFDLVLYSTPPITLAGVVRFVKERDNATTYLMLKDIFPQNAVDIGLMSKSGIKGLLYRYFRNKEKQLYSMSDRIGCMSPANVEYVLNHNTEISGDKVEVCPNCMEVRDVRLTEQERMKMREKYGIPQNKKVLVYGGNLGKPQDVPFIVDCLKRCAEFKNIYFVIAGSGTDRYLLEKYIQKEKPTHVKLFEQLPKGEYDDMIACCDVGLIFLDHRFTIPNFPSRLLSYMQAALPVLACTDPNTDIGKVIVDGGFGWWCESNDVRAFSGIIACIDDDRIKLLGKSSLDYLKKNYAVQQVYEDIIRK